MKQLLVTLALVFMSFGAFADRVDQLNAAPAVQACEVRTNLVYKGAYLQHTNEKIDAYIEGHQKRKKEMVPEYVRYNERELAYIRAHLQEGADKMAAFAKEYPGATEEASKNFAKAMSQAFNRTCMQGQSTAPIHKPKVPKGVQIKTQNQNLSKEASEATPRRVTACNLTLATCFDKVTGHSEAQIGAGILDCRKKFLACIGL